MKIIYFSILLILLVSCEKETPKTDSGVIESKQSKNCITEIDAYFSQFQQGCFSIDSTSAYCDDIETLILQSDGSGKYMINPDLGGIELKWSKDGDLIQITGMHKVYVNEVTDCSLRLSSGEFGEVLDANKNNLFKQCMQEINTKYGKQEADFKVTGSVTKVGKEIIFSLEGVDLNPISGKSTIKFPNTFQNQKVCAKSLK